VSLLGGQVLYDTALGSSPTQGFQQANCKLSYYNQNAYGSAVAGTKCGGLRLPMKRSRSLQTGLSFVRGNVLVQVEISAGRRRYPVLTYEDGDINFHVFSICALDRDE
jgi:hypothetical protein